MGTAERRAEVVGGDLAGQRHVHRRERSSWGAGRNVCAPSARRARPAPRSHCRCAGACFAMAFSNVLAQGGTPPERLEIDTVHVRRRQRQGLQHGPRHPRSRPRHRRRGVPGRCRTGRAGLPQEQRLAGQRGGPSERQPGGLDPRSGYGGLRRPLEPCYAQGANLANRPNRIFARWASGRTASGMRWRP